MKTHLRQVLKNFGINKIMLEEGSIIESCGLTADNGESTISVWYSAETTAPKTELHTVVVLGTGASEDELQNFNPKFIGTVILKNGYAAHVIEVKE